MPVGIWVSGMEMERRGVVYRAREGESHRISGSGRAAFEVCEDGFDLQRYSVVESLFVSYVHMAKAFSVSNRWGECGYCAITPSLEGLSYLLQ
jgi:hypothetical protein